MLNSAIRLYIITTANLWKGPFVGSLRCHMPKYIYFTETKSLAKLPGEGIGTYTSIDL